MSNNAMEDLTGGVGEYTNIPKEIKAKEREYTKRLIFNDMLATFRKHYLINASISPSVICFTSFNLNSSKGDLTYLSRSLSSFKQINRVYVVAI